MASPWERAKAKESYKDLKSSMPQGQAGGIGSTSSSSRKDYYQDPVERMRGKYFDNREDISRDRLERRLAQQQEYDLFKLTQMKPVSGASNLYQSRTPGGPTLADKAQELAMKYGPTPSEIAGDIGYGASKMLQAYGIPFVSTALKIGSAVSDAWNKVRGFFSPSQTPQGIETQFPRVSPKARGYFGGYNQGIDTQIPVANDRGMNIPVSIAQPVAYSPTTPVNTGFIPDGYSFGIGSVPINNSGFYPEAFDNVGIENPLFNNRQYDPININNMDLSGVNNLQLAGVNPEQRKMLDQYLFNQMLNEEIQRNRQQKFNKEQQMYQTNPVGQQVLFAKDGGSVDKYAGLGYKLR